MTACCEPVVSRELHQADADELAGRLKAVADPTRLKLISLLAAQPELEACVCDLPEALGVSQPTVSHHFKVLAEAGLVDRRKEGTWVHYRLKPEAFEDLTRALSIPVPIA